MVGIDEVGRGCLAGPLLVVAARAKAGLPAGIRDSKRLSKHRREALFDQLKITCDWGEGWVSASEINQLGLGSSLRLGVERALLALGVQPDEEILLDGSHNYVPADYKNSRTEPKADDKYPIVGAASIIAKVARDTYMQSLDTIHPDYGFSQHVGYGTKFHLDAVKTLGLIDTVHRRNFEPFKTLYA